MTSDNPSIASHAAKATRYIPQRVFATSQKVTKRKPLFSGRSGRGDRDGGRDGGRGGRGGRDTDGRGGRGGRSEGTARDAPGPAGGRGSSRDYQIRLATS